MPEYFDIHSHLNFPDFDRDRAEIIAEMERQNIATITVGTDLKTSREAVGLAHEREYFFATIGVHPTDIPSQNPIDALETLTIDSKVVAVGECGLDYARIEGGDPAEKKRQKELFEAQIALAVRHDLPLMIHCRKAYDDTLALLESKKAELGDTLRGDFHFFTESVEIAKRCLDLSFSLSVTGPITYTNQYNELVSFIPLEQLMTETDAPFAAPVPYRGKRNNPLYIKEIVQKVADIKQLDLDIVRKKVVENAFELFLKKSSSKPRYA